MDIHGRLAEFLRRLQAAPAAASAEEAMSLVGRLIEEVEDELCPLPRQNPAPRHFTGRMYAPQRDSIKPRRGGGLKANTRRHLIYCGEDGSILIIHKRRRRSVFMKAGKAK